MSNPASSNRPHRHSLLAPALAAAFLIVAGSAAAALSMPTPPDFSGTWVLNIDHSDPGGERPPQSKVQIVEHKGTELVITIDEVDERGPVHGTARYTTDGQDCVNDVFGNPITSSISWEGAIMIMRTWGKFGDADITLLDRWSISPDGKTLTIARQFHGQGRVVDQTLVFDRK